MTDPESLIIGWTITAGMYFLSSLHFLRAQSRYRRSRDEFLDCMDSMRSQLYNQQDEFNREFAQLNRAQKELQDKNALLKMHVENLRRANETMLADNKKRLEDVFKACDEIASLKSQISPPSTP